ncbi:MAG: sodium:proton antiporter NhaD [Parachlamydiaceae bacterium]|nr:sodium:proton antiporter NhaD [Parachlamydiaceae bacterium]
MNIYNVLTIIVFVIGYFFITIEHIVKINKTAIALLMAVLCWILQFLHFSQSHEENLAAFYVHIANTSQVVFFLLGALAIVEAISAHRGFNIISQYIKIRSKRKLLWLIGILAFFLSAVLDNLTTTIIMVTLIRKFIEKGEERLLVGGAVVIAANAGGAWTPIGDITTTMLWIGGQISTLVIMRDLFIPSLVCMIAALLLVGISLKGKFKSVGEIDKTTEPMGKLVFWLGIGCLAFVPIFKILTGLPPFMGVLLGVGIIWVITDIGHRKSREHRQHLHLPHIITQSDISSVLFFLGILLSIDALDMSGMLEEMALWMDSKISNPHMIAIVLGLISAVIDNVPLVAAIMGMYGIADHAVDSSFWQLVAYCAGTGGSILVIGSAAGVAFMGMEKVQFFWYLRRVGIPAIVGYFAGIGIYLLLL